MIWVCPFGTLAALRRHMVRRKQISDLVIQVTGKLYGCNYAAFEENQDSKDPCKFSNATARCMVRKQADSNQPQDYSLSEFAFLFAPLLTNQFVGDPRRILVCQPVLPCR